MSAEPYFLSARNPVANVDQRDLERLAIRLFARPDVNLARQRAAAMWRRVSDRLMPPDQMARFEDHVSDYCFKSVLVAAATDANSPRVLRVYSQGAEWLGHAVDAPATSAQERFETLFKLAELLELSGEREGALALFLELQVDAGEFRDVTRRISRLSRTEGGG